MEKEDYESNLSLFKEEVEHLHETCFSNVDGWYLGGEPLNGVAVGYTIDGSLARKLIHYIGLKHELLVLCPNDVVDIDVKDGKILGSFIRTHCGRLRIKP